MNEFCFKNNLRLNYNGQGNPDIDLYECFRHYQNVINMDGNNQIYCNICNKLCDSLYGTFLYTLPNYLILNLNRGKNAVYKCNVIFPQILNTYAEMIQKIIWRIKFGKKKNIWYFGRIFQIYMKQEENAKRIIRSLCLIKLIENCPVDL